MDLVTPIKTQQCGNFRDYLFQLLNDEYVLFIARTKIRRRGFARCKSRQHPEFIRHHLIEFNSRRAVKGSTTHATASDARTASATRMRRYTSSLALTRVSSTRTTPPNIVSIHLGVSLGSKAFSSSQYFASLANSFFGGLRLRLRKTSSASLIRPISGRECPRRLVKSIPSVDLYVVRCVSPVFTEIR